MKYRFEKDLGVDQPEESAKMPTVLGEDLGIAVIANTAGHQPGEDPDWAEMYELTVNEPDANMEEAAELLRHKLGTRVEIHGSILVVHLLSAKIRRRLKSALEELTQNSQVQPDSVRRAA